MPLMKFLKNDGVERSNTNGKRQPSQFAFALDKLLGSKTLCEL